MSGRVALVAGASKGIGAATAEAFAAAGAAVVLAARDTAALAAVADGIQARGGRALAVGADVTDAGSMRHVVDRPWPRSAGSTRRSTTPARARCRPRSRTSTRTSSTSASPPTSAAPSSGMKFQIPAMLASGGGAIVNMASIAGLNGTANLAAYVAGKAGIIGLTKVAALDYADQGIRVNVVAPGPILTYHLEAAGAQAQRGAAMSTPMRRDGQRPPRWPRPCSGCARTSPRSSPGPSCPVDGGQAAGNKPPQMYRPGQPMPDPDAARPERL